MSAAPSPSEGPTPPPGGGAGAGPVGLLLVHGIGSQKQGDSLDGLLAGLRDACGGTLTVRRVAEDHAVLEGIGRQVHVLEVFWADLLHGETVRGTFDFDRVFEVVWFPLFNHRDGQLLPDVSSRARVLWWTCVLAPLSSLLSVGLAGARFLATMPTAVQRSRAREAARLRAPQAPSWRERMRATYREARDPHVGRTLLDDLLDEVAGDVFNYVHGVADAFPVASARNDDLRANVAVVHQRFIGAAERALAHGCTEVQVLAHSLGTVVAFRGMCPDVRPADDAGVAARLTRLYTIGSPLEKFRFFWTRLIERAHHGPAIAAEARLIAGGQSGEALRWDNFHSRFDVVSGRLGRFTGWPAAVNHSVTGLGGLMTSHTSYTGSPVLMEMLLRGLTGLRVTVRVRWRDRVRHVVRSTAENLALPASLVALALFGLGVMGALGLAVGYVVTLPLEWLNLGALARGVRIYFVASIIFVMTVVSVGLGRSRARELHARFWARPERQPGATAP